MHSEVPNRFHYCNMSFKYSKRQRNKTCESHSILYRQMQSLYFTVETVFCACLCVLRQSLLMVSVQRLKHTLQSGSSERNERLRLGTGSSSSLCCLSASSSSSTNSTSLNSSARSCVRDLHTNMHLNNKDLFMFIKKSLLLAKPALFD